MACLSAQAAMQVPESQAAKPAMEPDAQPATHEDMERFFGHLSELMKQVDFHKGRAPEMVTARLRRLYLRANMDVREIKILRGLFSDTQRMLKSDRPESTEQ